MLDFSVYLVYRAGLAIIRVLPLRFLFSIGQFLGFGAWLLLRKYRHLALSNLRIAFGEEKSGADLRRLVRRHFQRLGANLLSGVKLAAIPPEKAMQYVAVENADAVHRELRSGRPVVLILSHLSNWELLAQLLPPIIGYVRNSTVYQKLGNPFIDAHVRKIRERTGVETFERSEGFHRAIELLRGGGAIGILSDQHAGDHGLWTPFFGRLASTSPLPGLLSKRTSAALIGAAVYTTGPGRWRLVFTHRVDALGDSVSALTAKANEVIAGQIRLAPEDWFWVHDRWKTPNPNFLLSCYKRGIFIPPQTPARDLKRFRILIRAPNWLGDCVMSVPTVRAIKEGRPDAHVTIAVPDKIAPVWELISEVDEVLSIPEHSLFATSRLLRQQIPFDVAIALPNSLRATLETYLGRIPRRVGFRGHHRRWLLNQIVPEPRKPGPLEHHSVRYLRIAHNLGARISSSRTIERETAGFPTATHQASDMEPQTPVRLALCPGAEYGPAKQWLPDRFIETASAVTKAFPAQWVLFGIGKDTAIGQQIAAALGENCINRIGKTTLAELIEELRECRLLLTNDTGTMHLANLLGIPTVAVFGSTEPALTGPLGNNHLILRHHVECSPCFLRECPIDFRCMKAVSVDEVRDAVISTLRREET